MATYLPSLKPPKEDEQDIRNTAGEVKTNSEATFSNRPFHKDKQVLDVQLEHIYHSSVQARDVV